MNRAVKKYPALKKALCRLFREEKGATAIEYGLIAGLIGLAITATLLAIGETVRDDIFGVFVTAIDGVLNGGGGGGGGGS